MTLTSTAQVAADSSVVKVPARNNKPQVISHPVQAGYWKLYSDHITGAISSVPATSLENLIVPNVKAALQGKVAGLYTVQANGMPVSEVAVRLRGISSIYGETDPLYVIDGVPAYAGPRDFPPGGVGGTWGATFNPLSDLNLPDIQSIEVLKDAAATALYGARGGNGVIVITTRSATANRSDVRVDYYNGITDVTNRRNVLTGPQYLQVLDQSWRNSGQTGEGPLPAIPGLDRSLAAATNTNNLDEILNRGRVQHLSLSASHGTAKSAFYFSGSYRNEKGALAGNNYRHYTGRIKMNNQLTSQISIGANIGISFSDYFNMPVGYSPGGGFQAAQLNLPILPYYNKDGTYFYPADPAVYNLPGTNVRSFLSKNDFDNEEHVRRISITSYIGYNLMPGLDLRVDAALDQFQHSRRDYLSRRLRYGSLGSGAGREGFPIAYAGYEKNTKNVYNLLGTLSYKKAKGHHNLTALAGAEFYYSDNPYFFAEGESFVSDFLRQPAAAAYRNQVTAQALTTNVHAVLGFFTTANYVYKERYLLNATVRVDASSRFGADHKYQVYPALSAGYILFDERLAQRTTPFNFLKLRASYGWSGNYGLGNYSALERWGLGTSSRYLLQAGVQALGLGSPSLKPEKLEQVNIGVDFALLNNRISGSIDVYNRTTKDLALLFPVPLSAGINEPGLLLNAGSLRNRGIELSLSTKNITGPFTWSTEVTVAHNQNKILSLGGLTPDKVSAHKNIVNFAGHATGVYYLAEYAGVDPATGQELIYDLHRNKVPAVSAAQIDEARIPHYNKPSVPKLFGGINNSFTCKGFDLSAFLTFSYGNYVLDEGERALSYVSGKNNLVADAAHSWTKENPQTTFPRLLYNDPIAGSNTTRFLHDASYLRMKNITLGYSFKNRVKQIKFLKDIRVYVAAQNLFTVTGFPGWDPEVSGNYLTNIERSQHTGITYMDMPQVKSIVAGINVKL